MRFVHPDLPGQSLRLAYCLNLHAAASLEGVLGGLRRVTLPLMERLFDAPSARAMGEGFGVGVWLPANVALQLAAEREDLARFTAFLVEHGLDAFTFNAFPFGGFHAKGLKESVFRPTWASAERLAYTLAVAQVAVAARKRFSEEWGAGVLHPRDDAHLSISTHAGAFAAWIRAATDLDAHAENLCVCAVNLARLEHDTGLRVVLSIEPEPRSTANDTRELSALHERIRARADVVIGRGYPELADLSLELADRHLGTCLDACHAAVEFEPPADALSRATAASTPLGKLQFSSALALPAPAEHPAGRAALLGLAEPVYLHQVTARGAAPTPGAEAPLHRLNDLPDLARALDAGEPAFAEAAEWRCHFHVPVDLAAVDGAAGLGTTRADADLLLDECLDHPERWGTQELHVEIETYTWDLLPGPARGGGALIDGLEREYRHVLQRLARRGWSPVVPPPPKTSGPR